MFTIGDKVNLAIAGRRVPGVIVAEPYPAVSEYISKDPARAGQTVTRPTTRALVVSLRETNPDGENPGKTYLTQTDENLNFAGIRHTPVIGLDADLDGVKISVGELADMAFESLLAFQAERAEAQTPAEVAI